MSGSDVLKRPDSILFVCSYNAIRSPMAAALVYKLFGSTFYVRSAGVDAGDPDGFLIEVMAEIGVDLSHHEPTAFDEFEERGFDLVITHSPRAHHKLLEETRTSAAVVEYWQTPDPSLMSTGNRQQRLDAYRHARDFLMQKIKDRFDYSLLS